MKSSFAVDTQRDHPTCKDRGRLRYSLTEGRPKVVEVVALGSRSEGDLLRLAAALEARSEHPIARAILARAIESGIAAQPAEAVQAITGRGMTGRVSRRVSRCCAAQRSWIAHSTRCSDNWEETVVGRRGGRYSHPECSCKRRHRSRPRSFCGRIYFNGDGCGYESFAFARAANSSSAGRLVPCSGCTT